MLTTNTYREMLSMLPSRAPSGNSARFWRMEDPEIEFRSGEPPRITKGGLFEHQRLWWNMPNFVKVLVTGYGGGKTMTLSKRMISLAMLNAPAPCAIVSPSYPQAKLTVIPTIQELLSGKKSLMGTEFSWNYNATPPIFFDIQRGLRRARLYILSADKPEAMKGGNLAAVGMDEPFIQPYDAFLQVMARVRHPLAKRLEIAIAGTPENLNWGYQLCEGELRKKHDVGVIHASTHDNLLMRGFARRLESGYDSERVRAYVGGQFVNMNRGRVYYQFEHQEHQVNIGKPADATWGVGMDFNVNPMSFVVFWHRPDGHMHFVREYMLPNSDTETACQTLLDDFPELSDVYPDASGTQRTTAASGISDFVILRRYGFRIHARPSNPSIRDRENAVNGKLRPHTGRVSLTIGERCVKLREYLEQYTHDLKNRQKHMSHILDAFGYPVAYLHPINRTGMSERTYAA